jgi:hypothetical protein
MKAYTGNSLPVIKLNVSSPEGDDNNKTQAWSVTIQDKVVYKISVTVNIFMQCEEKS